MSYFHSSQRGERGLSGETTFGSMLGERYIEPHEDDEPPAAPKPARAPRPMRVSANPDLGQAPAAPPPAPAGTAFGVIERFEFGKWQVLPLHQPQMIAMATRIRDSHSTAAPIRVLRLIGHTDPRGTEAFNLELGTKRAREVRKHLLATLARMRPDIPWLSRITVQIESRGESQPIGDSHERSRRVEILLPTRPPPQPQQAAAGCVAQSNALANERDAARRTLAKSAAVARRFIVTVGAVGARGRFVPTILDNKYWFAKLYELITYHEIGEGGRMAHPAFVFHFMPIFYDMYSDALDAFQRGDLGKVSPLWQQHFRAAARPDVSSFSSWQRGIQTSINTGVAAHIQGDMGTALERAYRSYTAKYCLPRPHFDTFRPDFFENNWPIFQRVQADLFLDLARFGPFPVRPEVAQALIGAGAQIAGGLDLNEVFKWRAAAWATAKRRLGFS
jgi:outer membrane protein OmpA-like peptidoglycan-associated protein